MPNQLPPITSSELFIDEGLIADIQSGRSSIWWKGKQPLWPTKNITFTDDDDYRRRALIRALTAPAASDEMKILGLKLFKCHSRKRCRSPLCNYCRTKIQDEFQKSVLAAFEQTDMSDLYWVTVLDDITADPVAYVPDWKEGFKGKAKRVFENNPALKPSRAFGVFEIDVKDTAALDEDGLTAGLLKEYGWQPDMQTAYMPHFHAIVELNGASKTKLKDALKVRFDKPKQVNVSPLYDYRPKEENLANLSRYMFKFRYQLADNILRSRPSYGTRFDDDTMRIYAQVVHDMKGDRGVTGCWFKYHM